MIDQTKYQNYIKLTRQLKGIKFNIERHQLQGTNNKMNYLIILRKKNENEKEKKTFLG